MSWILNIFVPSKFDIKSLRRVIFFSLTNQIPPSKSKSKKKNSKSITEYLLALFWTVPLSLNGDNSARQEFNVEAGTEVA